MLKHLPELLLCLIFGCLTALRLPAWHSDESIWLAAAASDGDDPWALNNAGHYLHESTGTANGAIDIWTRSARLSVPSWMPDADRWPYRMALINLTSAHLALGHDDVAKDMNDRANAITPSLQPIKVIRKIG